MTRWNSRVASLAALLALLTASCGSPAPTEPAAPPATPGEPSAAAPDSAQPTVAETEPGLGGDDPGYTTDDLGSGTVRIGDVEYTGFDGQCEFSKEFGAEVVDDPDGDGVQLVLGIDNAESSAQPQLGITATSTSGFRLLGHSAKRGEFTAMEFAGPRTVMEYVDIALVAITGATEDDDQLEAELVCLIQKP